MQCIQIISNGQMPTVNFAKIFCLYGDISKEDIEKSFDEIMELYPKELDRINYESENRD